MKLFSFTASKSIIIIDQNITYYFEQKNDLNSTSTSTNTSNNNVSLPYSYQMSEELLNMTTEEQDTNPNNITSNMCRHTLLNVVVYEIDEMNKKIYIAYENKWLCCYDLYTSEILSSTLLKKCPCGLSLRVFDAKNNKSVLIITDKAGDIWGLNANDIKKEMKLGGHTASIITDMQISKVGNAEYLLTCDRDEKIRISNFPYISNIHSFCVGHNGIVVNIDSMVVESSTTSTSTSAGVGVGALGLMVSGSWDNTIKLWSFPTETYKCLDTYHTPYYINTTDLETTTTPESDSTNIDTTDSTEPMDKRQKRDSNSNTNSNNTNNTNNNIIDMDTDAGVGAKVVPSGDGYKVKQYHVDGSEHIPMKVIITKLNNSTSGSGTSGLVGVVAILYKKQSYIQCIPIEYTQSQSQYQFSDVSKHIRIELEEFPCDFCFTNTSNTSNTATNTVQLQILLSNGIKTIDLNVNDNVQYTLTSTPSTPSTTNNNTTTNNTSIYQLNQYFHDKSSYSQHIMDKFIGAGGDLSESGMCVYIRGVCIY